MPSDLFGDSRLQLEHTRRRITEFSAATDHFWSINLLPGRDGMIGYSLRLNVEHLAGLKPLVGEVVNGLRHSLEMLIRAAAMDTIGDEAATQARLNIKFPYPDDERSIIRELNEQRRYISQAYQDAIERTFNKHAHYQYYLRVVRQASNNSKHWKLEPVAAQAYAVVIQVPGKEPHITDIPNDHFLSGQPFEWLGPASTNIRFVTSLQFADFPAEPPTNPKPPSPDDVFHTTAQYVHDMIEAFDEIHQASKRR